MADIPFTVTVSQVNRRLAGLVKGDSALRDIYVKGELSNFVNHYKTGHFYFTLKDNEASIKGIMFRNYAESVPFEPESGMSVIIRGGINVFERDGNNQLYAVEMLPDGVGSLYLAFEQTKARLEKEGYFSQKRPLPPLPKKICLITAETGAALQDMLNIISRRCPITSLLLIPSLVQGVGAPASIISALKLAQNTDADLIIFGRGGGSIEDLCAFNDEAVAKAIYNSRIPTVSAVGHETDFTIADFVADLRAPTPSAAAELSVPDMSLVYESFDNIILDIQHSISAKLSAQEDIVNAVNTHINLLSPANKLASANENIIRMQKEITDKVSGLISNGERELSGLADVISALSPMNVLSRGFSIVYKDGKVINSGKNVGAGDELVIQMENDTITAVIRTVSADNKTED